MYKKHQHKVSRTVTALRVSKYLKSCSIAVLLLLSTVLYAVPSTFPVFDQLESEQEGTLAAELVIDQTTKKTASSDSTVPDSIPDKIDFAFQSWLRANRIIFPNQAKIEYEKLAGPTDAKPKMLKLPGNMGSIPIYDIPDSCDLQCGIIGVIDNVGSADGVEPLRAPSRLSVSLEDPANDIYLGEPITDWFYDDYWYYYDKDNRYGYRRYRDRFYDNDLNYRRMKVSYSVDLFDSSRDN